MGSVGYGQAYAEERQWTLDQVRNIKVVKATNLGNGSHRWIQRLKVSPVYSEVCGEDVVYEESTWVAEGFATRTRDTPPETGRSEKMEQGRQKIPFYRGFDLEMRPWVSNVTYILGGLMATDKMGFILNNLWESFGQIVAWGAEVHYYEQGGHKRADWGHPDYPDCIPAWSIY